VLDLATKKIHVSRDVVFHESVFPFVVTAVGSTFESVSRLFSQGPSVTSPRVITHSCPINDNDHFSKHCIPTVIANEFPSEQHCTPIVVTDDFIPRHPLPSTSETNQHLLQPNTSENNTQNLPVSPNIHSDSLPANHSTSQTTPPPQLIPPARRSSRHHNVPGYLQDY
ncbi:hypothetical protein HAX54_015792, partial [Datura stramonium]|nr:hypothetical protein [Datura stramonium]